MNPLPFLPQERPETCVPACLRMLLTSYGIKLSEAEIAAGCQTDSDGTIPTPVVHYAQSLGFEASAQRLLGLEALQSLMMSKQITPIAYVHLAPLLGINVIHAVLIEGIDLQNLSTHVIDPAYPPTGRRVWPLTLFLAAWKLARYQVILVTPRQFV